MNFSEVLEGAPAPRPWIVRDLLLRGSITMLSGPGAKGLALRLAGALVSGEPWGGFAIKKPYRVLVAMTDNPLSGGLMETLDFLKPDVLITNYAMDKRAFSVADYACLFAYSDHDILGGRPRMVWQTKLEDGKIVMECVKHNYAEPGTRTRHFDMGAAS